MATATPCSPAVSRPPAPGGVGLCRRSRWRSADPSCGAPLIQVQPTPSTWAVMTKFSVTKVFMNSMHVGNPDRPLPRQRRTRTFGYREVASRPPSRHLAGSWPSRPATSVLGVARPWIWRSACADRRSDGAIQHRHWYESGIVAALLVSMGLLGLWLAHLVISGDLNILRSPINLPASLVGLSWILAFVTSNVFLDPRIAIRLGTAFLTVQAASVCVTLVSLGLLVLGRTSASTRAIRVPRPGASSAWAASRCWCTSAGPYPGSRS